MTDRPPVSGEPTPEQLAEGMLRLKTRAEMEAASGEPSEDEFYVEPPDPAIWAGLPATRASEEPSPAETTARFWNYIDKTPTCWRWTGSLVREGYGFLRVNGKTTPAHRFAYELLVGPIQDGLTIDHLCRVRHCVNPEHLEPVTRDENTLRGTGPTARHARQTHCKQGHPLDVTQLENGRPRRRCSICSRGWRQAWKARARARRDAT
jgi:hypothetical protein